VGWLGWGRRLGAARGWPRQRRVDSPFQLEAADGSEACIGLDGVRRRADNGRVREAELELVVARWGRRRDGIRPVCRPREQPLQQGQCALV